LGVWPLTTILLTLATFLWAFLIAVPIVFIAKSFIALIPSWQQVPVQRKYPAQSLPTPTRH
jgi:hypothetical protein